LVHSDHPEAGDRISGYPEADPTAYETRHVREEHDPSKAAPVALKVGTYGQGLGDAPGCRTGDERESFKRSVVDHLLYTCGREPEFADTWAVYEALSYAIRDRLIHHWIATRGIYRTTSVKRVHYL